MDTLHGGIGSRCQNYETVHAVHHIIDARKEQRLIREGKAVFPFPCIPLIIRRGGNHTPLRRNAAPKHGFFRYGFGAGIDDEFALEIGNAPFLEFTYDPVAGGDHHRSNVGGGDFGGGPVRRGGDGVCHGKIQFRKLPAAPLRICQNLR